jgi:hypothetical protein
MTSNDVVLELLDKNAEAEDLEMLVSQIKAIIYSPFRPEEMKISDIKKEIKEAGY